MNKDKFSQLISVFTLVFISFYIVNNPDSYKDLLIIDALTVGIVVLIKSFTLILNSIFNFQLLKAFKVNLNYFEALYISSVTFLGNFYLPARSGANFRLLYLNRVHNLKSPALTSIFFYFVFVTILLSSFFGMVSLIIIRSNNSFLYFASLILLFCILNFSIFILQKRYTVKNKSKNTFRKWINKTQEEWNLISSKPRLQFFLISITTLNYFLFALELTIIFNFMFNKIPLFEIFYFNSLSLFSSLVSITPASLGIKEAIILISNDILGFELANLVSILFIERTISIIFSIIPSIVLVLNTLKSRAN